MTLLGVLRRFWFIVGVLVIPACAPLPPERVARRANLDKAASECQRTFPIIERYQIDNFDQLIYYYKPSVRYEDREQFLNCVRDRIRDAGLTLGPPPAPTASGTGAPATLESIRAIFGSSLPPRR